MSMTSELTPLFHELYTALQALYGDRLERLMLYGSHARGQARPDSDVDVLVVLKGEVDLPGLEIDRMMDTLYELNLKHDVFISAVPVSSAAYHRAESPLLMNVHREGILVGQEVA